MPGWLMGKWRLEMRSAEKLTGSRLRDLRMTPESKLRIGTWPTEIRMIEIGSRQATKTKWNTWLNRNRIRELGSGRTCKGRSRGNSMSKNVRGWRKTYFGKAQASGMRSVKRVGSARAVSKRETTINSPKVSLAKSNIPRETHRPRLRENTRAPIKTGI